MSSVAESVALEIAGEVEIKFTENVPGSKNGIIIVMEGETLTKAIKREYQRRCNALVMDRVRILGNLEFLVIIKEIPTVVSRLESTIALRRATVKVIIANKIVMELREILVKSRKEIKRLKPTPATKNSAYQDF